MTIEEFFKGHESSAEKYRENWKMGSSIVAGYNLLWAQEQVKNRSSDYNDDTSYLLYDFISSSLCDHISLGDVYSCTMSTLSSIQVCKNVILFINKNKMYELHSSEFETDDKMGMCMDGDGCAVRYINISKEKSFKMKAGKFIKHIIEDYRKETGFTVTEELSRYVQERFAAEWKSAHNFINDKVELVVDKDFEAIYDNESCDGDFGSCMSDRNQYKFYEKSILCSAAYIQSKETGLIMARCILYDEVHEKGTDNIWRLAERQYSKNGDLFLKQVLIDKLIEAERIDGYKRVGASYDDNRDFVNLDGVSLDDKVFYVEMDLDNGDTLSYQDSFKYYNERSRIAYNSKDEDHDSSLDMCDQEFRANILEYYRWNADAKEYELMTGTRDFVTNECEFIGEAYYKDYVEEHGELYLYDDGVVVEVNGEFVYYEDAVLIDNDYHLKSDCVMINSKWYPYNSCAITKTWNGGYVLSDNAIVTETGEIVCKDDEAHYIIIDGHPMFVRSNGTIKCTTNFLQLCKSNNIKLEDMGIILTIDGSLVREDHCIQLKDGFIGEADLGKYFDIYINDALATLNGFNEFCKKYYK